MLEKIFYGTGFGREHMSAARAAYLFLVWVLVPTWLVLLFMQMLVGLAFTGGFAMLSDRLGAEVTFRRPFVTWTGDIGLENLRVRPLEGGGVDSLSLDVRRLRVDMPNWGVMQSLFAEGEDEDAQQAAMLRVFDRMDHVGVHMEGFKFDSTQGLPGTLRYVGVASGAPLEAEGCKDDTLWLGSELPKLGIDNQGIDLDLTLANAQDAREVRITGSLVSPRSSRVEFAQHFKAASLSSFLDAPDGSRNAIYERLAIQDEGFIAARDAYCAKRDGVDRATFRERHLAAVHRLLEAEGMRASAPVEAAYLQYLDKGRLVLEAHPSATIRREDYHHYSLADQLRMYRGTVVAQGRPVPLEFEAIPSRFIPAKFEGSTWDLIAAERGEALPSVGGMPAPATTPVATLAVAKPALVAAAPPPVAAPAPIPAAPAPMAMPGSRRFTADGRPLASSLPSAPSTRRQFKELGFDELGRHLGEFIELTTVHGVRREGHVDSVRGQTLRLRVSAGLGHAIVNVERASIRSLRHLD